MTAPDRQHGMLVQHIERGCISKNRYSDEFAARAMGRIMSKQNAVPLWVYRCKLCSGWHLTKHPQNGAERVTNSVDYNFDQEPA